MSKSERIARGAKDSATYVVMALIFAFFATIVLASPNQSFIKIGGGAVLVVITLGFMLCAILLYIEHVAQRLEAAASTKED
ncbi:MAG: hypothetical protein QOE22_689 [Candidatus Parcubacteria bacterium]|jgi:hypothetical protein|nr:hypothetical protein [Candidatus Parcubacteria bacterium]